MDDQPRDPTARPSASVGRAPPRLQTLCALRIGDPDLWNQVLPYTIQAPGRSGPVAKPWNAEVVTYLQPPNPPPPTVPHPSQECSPDVQKTLARCVTQATRGRTPLSPAPVRTDLIFLEGFEGERDCATWIEIRTDLEGLRQVQTSDGSSSSSGSGGGGNGTWLSEVITRLVQDVDRLCDPTTRGIRHTLGMWPLTQPDGTTVTEFTEEGHACLGLPRVGVPRDPARAPERLSRAGRVVGDDVPPVPTETSAIRTCSNSCSDSAPIGTERPKDAQGRVPSGAAPAPTCTGKCSRTRSWRSTRSPTTS